MLNSWVYPPIKFCSYLLTFRSQNYLFSTVHQIFMTASNLNGPSAWRWRSGIVLYFPLQCHELPFCQLSFCSLQQGECELVEY